MKKKKKETKSIKRPVYLTPQLNKKVNEAILKRFGEGRGAYQLFARKAMNRFAEAILKE